MRKEEIETDSRYHDGDMSSSEAEKLNWLGRIVNRMISRCLPITLRIVSSGKDKSDGRVRPLSEGGIDSRTRERTSWTRHGGMSDKGERRKMGGWWWGEENRGGARCGIIATSCPSFFLWLSASPTSGSSAKPH